MPALGRQGGHRPHLPGVPRPRRRRAGRATPATRSTPPARCSRARAGAMPLRARARFQPDLEAIPADVLAQAKLMFLNYPNNPTGAVIEDDFFERAGRVRRDARHPRRPRQRLLRDHLRRLPRAELPGDARRQGRRHRGVLALQDVQHDRLAFGRVVGNADLVKPTGSSRPTSTRGMFEAVQDASVAAIALGPASVAEMCAIYQRRRDLLVEALRAIGLSRSTRPRARSTSGRGSPRGRPRPVPASRFWSRPPS